MSALPAKEQKRALVRSMFERIAPRYDLLNRLLTAGLDQRWRRRTLTLAGVGAADTVLDLACGTGDLSARATALGARVIGIDFAQNMLRRARARPVRAHFVQGDAEHLPLPTASVDVVVCGFALRNFVSIETALAEMARVLRATGRLALLEVGRPEHPLLGAAHALYFDRIVPQLGSWLSDRDAYRYLPESTAYLPAPRAFRALLEARGIGALEHHALMFGAAQIWLGRKGAAP